MLTKKLLTKVCALGVCVYCLTQTAAFAADYNGGKDNGSGIPTDKLKIFEQDDEKETYTQHGFTRGDMSFLFDATFDPSEIENVSGEVAKVMRIQYPDKDCYVIALLSTKANNGKIAVNLGPIWYLEENNMKINEGDAIQVTGAKMRTNGRFVIIATELTKNGQTLNIRDKEGTALWGSPRAQNGDAQCMKLMDMKKAPSKPSMGSSNNRSPMGY